MYNDMENTLLSMEEDGDYMAELAFRDLQEEKGLLMNAWTPKLGELVFILTGAFYHIGRWAGEDAKRYYLEKNSVTILETGPFQRLLTEGIYGQGESVEIESFIQQTSVAQVIKWPLPELPRRG